MVVEGLLYTKEHEWARMEAETATVGITDHAQKMLGEVVFVELPSVGQELGAGSELGVVESSKAASDIYSPVTGKVAEVNSELDNKPELINEDCYGTGWICKIEIIDSKSMDALMDSKQYQEYLKSL